MSWFNKLSILGLWNGGTPDVVSNSNKVPVDTGLDQPIEDGGSVVVESQSVVKRSITASASGDSTVHTPTGSNKIRLYFFGYSAGADVTGVLVGLKLTGYNSGNVFDQQYLVAPGQPYARNIQGGKRYIEGSAGGALTVNLGAAETVYVNYELEEVA